MRAFHPWALLVIACALLLPWVPASVATAAVPSLNPGAETCDAAIDAGTLPPSSSESSLLLAPEDVEWRSFRVQSPRLVAVSTDYVYPGVQGNYSEDDPVQPFGLAGLGKLGGECAVRMHARSLVIRTSFCPDRFNFPFAFRDQFVSKDTVAVIAPIVSISPLSRTRM